MRILICPLDWGLGHTARMIPVACELLQEGYQVTLGGSRRQLEMFSSDMPAVERMLFPGFTIRYSKWLPVYLITLIRTPLFLISVIREHYRLKKIVRDNHFDMVISDNRMGLWHKSIRTVYYTHMIRVPMPATLRFLEPAGVWMHRQIINMFDECRIPDIPGRDGLAGRLAHDVRLPVNATYTGILSKFNICNRTGMELPADLKKAITDTYDLLILSGPEPQRSILREMITRKRSDNEVPLVILEGKPAQNAITTTGRGVISVPHLPPPAMAALIAGSREITARSGYTTIMELASLNRRATLIPTPGQTEQEYLAKRHSKSHTIKPAVIAASPVKKPI